MNPSPDNDFDSILACYGKVSFKHLACNCEVLIYLSPDTAGKKDQKSQKPNTNYEKQIHFGSLRTVMGHCFFLLLA